jgi:uncharacterized protein YyaL (SSP411 family)
VVNRLATATSPYLLQHADNPVDWFPWGDEALTKARTEDRPIFLSIGYAACHWCHVMERESFEDKDTAAFLNEHFVAIKVDREERPDLDAIYMDAVQALNHGQGGWPLSAFLTPSGEPFFAGTYYPKVPAHGMPSFRQVLEGIAEAWDGRRHDLERQAARVVEAISTTTSLRASTEPLTDAITTEALASLARSFDPTWGGFGSAPKFPQPMTLEFVLRMAVRSSAEARTMLATTLDRMAGGGIHDQLGGGFARYATDSRWLVPHFEKMLSDNAQLAQLYTRAWLVSRDDRYRRVAVDTLAYLLREMRHPAGGFFSSQDADSEGVEGKFFVWSWEELVEIAGEDAAAALGASPDGNWEGTNVLWRPPGSSEDDGLEEARRALFEAREGRVRPATDDKVLTAWNAMAIQALAEASSAFDDPTLLEEAAGTADFVVTHLRGSGGRLLRSWRDGTAGGPGYADDHALLASALLALYARTGDVRWYREAARLAEDLRRLFADADRGGFFQTGADVDPLVVRPKDLYDNAVPSGNSAAADVLLRLSLLTGDAELERAGLSAIRLIRDVLGRAPTGFGHALCALDLSLGPSNEVAIVGPPDDPATRALLGEVVATRFLPNTVVAVGAPGDREQADAVPLLRDRPLVDGSPTAYVCRRFACKLPVTEPADLARSLEEAAV